MIFWLILVSYLIGAVPYSLIFSKIIKGVDVRQSGTRNVGATNAIISAGIRAGSLSLVFDVLKGFSAVFLARVWVGGDLACVLAGFFVVVGHDFPFYLRFKGGKGIAPSGGAMMAINPFVTLICLAAYPFFLLLTRYFITATLLTMAILPFMVWIFKLRFEYILFALALFALALYTHFRDLQKIFSGKELKVSQAVKKSF